MLAPTHVGIGIAGMIIAARVLETELDGVAALAVMIGALAPDIDHPGSAISRPGGIFSRFLPRGARLMIDSLAQVATRLLHLLLGHRGVTHWVALPLLLIAAGIYFTLPALAWFGLGALLHVLADACTVSGVPLLGPLTVRPISLLPIRTGGWFEKLVVFPAAVGLIAYLGWPRLPPESRDLLLRFIAR